MISKNEQNEQYLTRYLRKIKYYKVKRFLNIKIFQTKKKSEIEREQLKLFISKSTFKNDFFKKSFSKKN